MNVSEFEAQFLGLECEEFDKMDALNIGQKAAAYAIILLELFVHLLTLPISATTFYIISITTVLHRNLKFILLVQCASILFASILRLFFTAPIKFWTGDLFWTENEFRSLYPVEFLLSAPLFFRMFLGHVIILERIMATLWARRYEIRSGNAFSAGWFSAVFLVTLIHVVLKHNEQTHEHDQQLAEGIVEEDNFHDGSTLLSLITACVLAVVSFLEILLFIFLWIYNKTVFNAEFEFYRGSTITANNKGSVKRRSYQLTKRYQLLENVRTTSQLRPTLAIYFLMQFLTACSQAYHYFVFKADEYPEEIISQSNNLVTAMLNLLIELTTILYHPILRIKFFALFKCILPHKIGKVSAMPSMTSNLVTGGNHTDHQLSPIRQTMEMVQIGPNAGGGGAQKQTENHFTLLKRIWE